MRTNAALAFGIAVVVLALAGCRSAATLDAQSPDLAEVHGVIEAVNPGNGWFGIVPDGDRGTRYAPDRLPDEFKKDGVRVVFSGRVGRIDPNVRTWGIPLTLTSIRAEPTR